MVVLTLDCLYIVKEGSWQVGGKTAASMDDRSLQAGKDCRREWRVICCLVCYVDTFQYLSRSNI